MVDSYFRPCNLRANLSSNSSGKPISITLLSTGSTAVKSGIEFNLSLKSFMCDVIALEVQLHLVQYLYIPHVYVRR